MCTPFALAALFTTAKKKLNKMLYLNTMEYYSLNNKKVLTHATLMNLKDMMLSGIRQTQNGKYCMIPFIWVT